MQPDDGTRSKKAARKGGFYICQVKGGLVPAWHQANTPDVDRKEKEEPDHIRC